MCDKYEINNKDKSNEIYEIYLNKALNSPNINDAIENMKLALIYAKSKIPTEILKAQQLKGSLWSDPKARDYLIIKGQLGYLYEISGDYDNAICVYEKLLKLDTNDNQNVKDKLIPLYILKGKEEQAYKLIKIYEKDKSAAMLYNKALYYFVTQDKFNAKLFIKKAMKANKYVPEYLIGIKNVNFPIENKFELGSEDEAKCYFNDAMIVWIQDKKTLLWLVDEYFIYIYKNNIELEWDKKYIKDTIETVFKNITE